MECQDCNKSIATKVIFSMKDLMFFAVCGECVTEEDHICPKEIIEMVY